tara:strand:- start:179 stop:379 length:201 start_codon:yes stop_codon:yes gene_type:complete
MITQAIYEKETITHKDGTEEIITLGVRATINEVEMFVPISEENRHYQEILLWVADGNTITDNGGSN